MSGKYLNSTFKPENNKSGRKWFRISAILIRLLLFAKYTYASLDCADNHLIYVKSYYILLNESIRNQNAFVDYQRYLSNLIKKAQPDSKRQIRSYSSLMDRRECELWFLAMFYEYIKRETFAALENKRPSFFYLKFKTFGDLLDCAVPKTRSSNGAKMLLCYTKLAQLLGRNKNWEISERLAYFIEHERLKIESGF